MRSVASPLSPWAGAAMMAAAFILVSTASEAQVVNVAKALADIDQKGLYGSVQGSLDWQTGNTRTLSVFGKLDLFLNLDRHLVFASASASHATQGEDDVVFISKTFEHLRYRIAILDWLGLETFGQHDFNRFRRLRIRALGGIGPRVSLELVQDLFFLSLGTSYMFEFTEASKGDHDDSSVREYNHRWNNYLSVVLTPRDNVSLDSTLYVQPRFDHMKDLLLLSESGLTVEIVSWLTLRVSYSFFLDTRPFDDVHNYDSALKTTLGVRFGPWFAPPPAPEPQPTTRDAPES